MTLHVKNGGSWKNVSELHVKDGGVWKQAQEGWVKDAGTWKQFFSNATWPIVTRYRMANSGQEYTATPPAGATHFSAKLWGGGGSGSNSTSFGAGAGAGGGGGEVVPISKRAISGAIKYVLRQGGPAPAGGAGNDGGTSSLEHNGASIATAEGGKGGNLESGSQYVSTGGAAGGHVTATQGGAGGDSGARDGGQQAGQHGWQSSSGAPGGNGGIADSTYAGGGGGGGSFTTGGIGGGLANGQGWPPQDPDGGGGGGGSGDAVGSRTVIAGPGANGGLEITWYNS